MGQCVHPNQNLTQKMIVVILCGLAWFIIYFPRVMEFEELVHDYSNFAIHQNV